MLQTSTCRKPAASPRLRVGMARDDDQIRAAQRLRHRVFAQELGARLDSRSPGLDRDIFDPHCEHLVVWDEDSGRVVGTYRILAPEAARRVGAYYADGEFDLTRLQHLRGRLVEIGRSCIDADYRQGAVIALLWQGIARYLRESGYDYLMGCASIGMADGGHNAAALYQALGDRLSPPEYRVFPRCPLPLERIGAAAAAHVPPLIKGYMRAGAWVCGEPAWDPDFNTADLLLLLPVSRVESRYARHFLDAA